jgi:hypothetical protein
LALVACAGSDVPERGDDGAGGTQTGTGATAGSGGASGAGGAGSGGTGAGGTGAGGTGGAGSSGSGAQVENGGSGGSSDCGGAQILITNCGSASCHGGGIGTFAKDEAALADAIGTASSSYATSCGSGLLIDPSDATQGVIYNKISGGTCGPQMPLGATPLSPADQDCVESFLTSLEE